MAELSAPGASLDGRSERLREFVEAAPLERFSIYRFVVEQARLMPVGARVLDVGAGDAPYRELFDEQEYVTLDHSDTPHSGAVDIYGSADAIPVDDQTFDAILCTQVLEHVAQPLDATREFARVLRPSGVAIVTVPFLWEEHETPHDYYRYTRYGIEHVMRSAGFSDVEVRPRTDCFTSLAQLMRNAGWAMGSAPDGRDALRQQAREALEVLADALAVLAPLDVALTLPLGFTVRAIRADADTA